MWVRVTISSVVLSNHALESKLLLVSGEVAKVLEACNENAKGIDKLSDTMISFTKQLLGHLEEGLWGVH